MKKAAFVVLATTLLFAGCSTQEPPQPATEAKTEAKAEATPKPAQAPRAASPERIAEIEASGRTGLWSSVTEVCPADVKTGIRTTLTWNVKASGATRVILYVLDADGKERHFGQGAAVGERETGPWLVPGRAFRVRDFHQGNELGTVVIGRKSC